MDLIPKQDFDGKWGFVDNDGVWQITPLYDSVEPFDGDYATGFVDGQNMFIDKEGHWFKECPKDSRPDEEDILLEQPSHRSVMDILTDGFGQASDILHKGLDKLD